MDSRESRRGRRSIARSRWVSRRGLLRAAGRAGIGVAGLALVGCGGDDGEPPAVGEVDEPAAPQQEEARPTVNPLRRAPTRGAPTSGGSLTIAASLLNLDFFDSHRAQFPATQLFASLQQSKLLRFADIDSGVLEPDLATLPEIPDEETYVFLMRPDARWREREPTNGRAITAEDVRLNIERQIAGLDAAGAPDSTLERQSLYERTASIETFDGTTIVLRTSGTDSTYLSSVQAGPWSFMQPHETWDLFGDALRDEPLRPQYYAGSGPFQLDRFLPREEARFIASPSFFRDGAPFLRDLTLRDSGGGGTTEAAYRAGEIDVWCPPDGASVAGLLAEFPDHVLESRPLPFGIELAFSFRQGSGNPLVDARLARAVHIAANRRAIIAAAYGENGQVSGPAPWYTPGWATPVASLSEQPGYRDSASVDGAAADGAAADRAEAVALLEAAGFSGPLRLHLPDVFAATYPGLADVVQSSFAEALGIRVEIAIDQYPRLLEGIEDGSVPVMIGWSEPITDPDPTDRLEATMTTGAAGNRGGFSDPIVDTWIGTMRGTLDFAERQRIFHEAVVPSLWAEPSWALNIGHGVQRIVHPAEVHLPAFGFGWDGYRWEEAWIES